MNEKEMNMKEKSLCLNRPEVNTLEMTMPGVTTPAFKSRNYFLEVERIADLRDRLRGCGVDVVFRERGMCLTEIGGGAVRGELFLTSDELRAYLYGLQDAAFAGDGLLSVIRGYFYGSETIEGRVCVARWAKDEVKQEVKLDEKQEKS